jgi:hypothetical protein
MHVRSDTIWPNCASETCRAFCLLRWTRTDLAARTATFVVRCPPCARSICLNAPNPSMRVESPDSESSGRSSRPVQNLARHFRCLGGLDSHLLGEETVLKPCYRRRPVRLQKQGPPWRGERPSVKPMGWISRNDLCPAFSGPQSAGCICNLTLSDTNTQFSIICQDLE